MSHRVALALCWIAATAAATITADVFDLSPSFSRHFRIIAVDYMDDGTPIELTLTIDRNARTATFDFTGTGPEVRVDGWPEWCPLAGVVVGCNGSPVALTLSWLAVIPVFYQVYGNCNAPRAVAKSAILYCLRCLIDEDIPLNQGIPLAIGCGRGEGRFKPHSLAPARACHLAPTTCHLLPASQLPV